MYIHMFAFPGSPRFRRTETAGSESRSAIFRDRSRATGNLGGHKHIAQVLGYELGGVMKFL